MKYYITTDTHFNHTDLRELCGRPKDIDKIIADNLFGIDKKECLVHLGDVCIGKDKEVHDKIIKKIKCKKILVRGNHDRKNHGWYLDNGWDFMCDFMGLEYGGQKILFSHMPSAWDQWYTINIHGHFHNSQHRGYPEGCDPARCRLIAIEHANYKPVSLLSILSDWKPVAVYKHHGVDSIY